MARRQIFRRNSKGSRNQVHRRKRTNQSIRTHRDCRTSEIGRGSHPNLRQAVRPRHSTNLGTNFRHNQRTQAVLDEKIFRAPDARVGLDRHFANKLESPAAVVSSHLEPYVVRNQTCRKGACNHRRESQLPGPSECTADQQQRERWYRKPSLLRQTGFRVGYIGQNSRFDCGVMRLCEKSL